MGDKPFYESTTFWSGMLLVAATVLFALGKITEETWRFLVLGGGVGAAFGLRKAIGRSIRVVRFLPLLLVPALAQAEVKRDLFVGVGFGKITLPFFGEKGDIGLQVKPILGVVWVNGDWSGWLGGTLDISSDLDDISSLLDVISLAGGGGFSILQAGLVFDLKDSWTLEGEPGFEVLTSQGGIDVALSGLVSFGDTSENIGARIRND